MDLLLASGNAKKLSELSRLVADLDIRVLTPKDVEALPEVDEDGLTFEANAAKKARAWALASGLTCIADDSGLEVDALDGAPGVHSARFAGTHGDDQANNDKLLKDLAELPGGCPDEQRGARFVCAIHVARPDGSLVAAARGTVAGRIVREPQGSGGFGYDPLFLCLEGGQAPFGSRTFGQVSPAEKATVSHRSRALRALRDDLAIHRSQAQNRGESSGPK